MIEDALMIPALLILPLLYVGIFWGIVESVWWVIAKLTGKEY